MKTWQQHYERSCALLAAYNAKTNEGRMTSPVADAILAEAHVEALLARVVLHSQDRT